MQELGLSADPTNAQATIASPVSQQRSFGRYIPTVPSVPNPQPILNAAVRSSREMTGAVAGGVSGVVGYDMYVFNQSQH